MMLFLMIFFTSALAYKSQPYAEGISMRLDVSYTPYATNKRYKTGNIITFINFEEGNLSSETQSL